MSEPRRRLAAVDGLLSDAVEPSVRLRGSVWLMRLAIEHALRDLWIARAPTLEQATMRAQLLILPKYLGLERALWVGSLWRSLSRVAHHHAYELTPTRVEIEMWRSEVADAVDTVEKASELTRT